MFERYTDEAKRAIFFAHQEAQDCGYSMVDTLHLLLGICHDRNNKANRSFALHKKKKIFKEILGPLPNPPYKSIYSIPLTISSKRSLAYAAEAADLYEHYWINTCHLLAGILTENDPTVIEACNRIELNPDQVSERLAQASKHSDLPVLQKLKYRYQSLPLFPRAVIATIETIVAILIGVVLLMALKW